MINMTDQDSSNQLLGKETLGMGKATKVDNNNNINNNINNKFKSKRQNKMGNNPSMQGTQTHLSLYKKNKQRGI